MFQVLLPLMGLCTTALPPAAPLAPQPPALGDWILAPGEVATYDTARGRLDVNRLVIPAGATLRVRGIDPFLLVAADRVVVRGTLDLSAVDSAGVVTINTTNQPELGSEPGPAGGGGGTGSAQTQTSTLIGGDGGSPTGDASGGDGGESAFGLGGPSVRRAAGGGGGRFGPDLPVFGNPFDLSNIGKVARSGQDGSSQGTSAFTGTGVALGGSPGAAVFADNDPTNDFWGVRTAGGSVVVGELPLPRAGSGGGAGGDAIDSASVPSSSFILQDDKGAGGGGGGGLALILTETFLMGPEGQVRADGGDGGGGENTFFFNRVGGGSGGGSGGMIVIEADTIDLRLAGPEALRARGGRGGAGENDQHGAIVGAGGDGGPGLIQLHVEDATDVWLAPGASVDDVSLPGAWVLDRILMP